MREERVERAYKPSQLRVSEKEKREKESECKSIIVVEDKMKPKPTWSVTIIKVYMSHAVMRFAFSICVPSLTTL